ncbi:Panacea domain-containing protein [Roseibium aggregatum]|uniref:Panacea domain-containing protein n=1 Tax=Roseibium aggregatum TaxID=187304 RepID=UPI003A97D508
MAHDAREIANFFLDCAEEEDLGLTPMTLLKILYFAHAWHLTKYDEPLVGQQFEAWQYGPVNSVVYDQIKVFKASPIKEKLKKFSPSEGRYIQATAEISEDKIQFLRDIFRYYSRFSSFTLSDLSHETNGPWDKVWREAETRAVPGMFIPNYMIKEWFEQNRGEEPQ